MKKITIKALILSLLMLSAPNTRCDVLGLAGVGLCLGVIGAVGAVAGAVVAGIFSGVGFLGYKAAKKISSKKTERKRKKAAAKRKRKSKKPEDCVLSRTDKLISKGKKVDIQVEPPKEPLKDIII